ncbi:MAG: GPP34 family phosphoprotein [Microbacterium sp.]
MLITEELRLLLLRPDGRGESSAWSYRAYGEVAAVVVDLVLHRRVVVTDEKHPVVHVVQTTPTGHPVLDATLARLAPLSGRRLSSLVTRSSLDPRDEVTASLIAQGVLDHGERGFFGLGAERTPEADPHPEAALRSRLAAVLAGTIAPQQPDLTLLAILQAMNAAHSILRAESGGLSAGRLKKRIAELAAGSPAGDAVSSAVSAVIVAMMTATMIPVMVATTS